MTYEQFINDFGVSMTEPQFNLFKSIFDSKYGVFATAKGIYDEALTLFLLHQYATSGGTASSESLTVGAVSISKSDSTYSNYDQLLMDLLKANGWVSSVFGGFIARGNNGCQ